MKKISETNLLGLTPEAALNAQPAPPMETIGYQKARDIMNNVNKPKLAGIRHSHAPNKLPQLSRVTREDKEEKDPYQTAKSVGGHVLAGGGIGRFMADVNPKGSTAKQKFLGSVAGMGLGAADYAYKEHKKKDKTSSVDDGTDGLVLRDWKKHWAVHGGEFGTRATMRINRIVHHPITPILTGAAVGGVLGTQIGTASGGAVLWHPIAGAVVGAVLNSASAKAGEVVGIRLAKIIGKKLNLSEEQIDANVEYNHGRNPETGEDLLREKRSGISSPAVALKATQQVGSIADKVGKAGPSVSQQIKGRLIGKKFVQPAMNGAAMKTAGITSNEEAVAEMQAVHLTRADTRAAAHAMFGKKYEDARAKEVAAVGKLFVQGLGYSSMAPILEKSASAITPAVNEFFEKNAKVLGLTEAQSRFPELLMVKVADRGFTAGSNAPSPDLKKRITTPTSGPSPTRAMMSGGSA